MELKKYKLADIAKIEISGVDKKTIEGEHLGVCVTLLMSIIIGLSPKKRLRHLWLHQPNRQRLINAQ